MRRLVWIVDQLGPGGAEQLALRFAAEPSPFRIELVSLHAAPESLQALWGNSWEAVRGRVHVLGMRGLDDAGSWGRLLRLLRAWEPALLHLHLRYAIVWGGWAAHLLRLPYVVTVHQGPHADRTRCQRFIATCERWSRRHAARVVYVSGAQRKAWGRIAGRERTVVIGNGVALADPASAGERAALRRALGLPPHAPVYVTVAVVRAAKGWRTWLEAAERIVAAHPEACLVWVGGGPEWEQFRQAAAHSHACGHLVLAGQRSDVTNWLRASDVFLFPSQEEAQPTAVMEAMAAALPIIASRLPAIAEVLDGSGWLVPAQNPAALAEAALAWSDADHPARRASAAAARQRAEATLSESRWHRRMLELYADVLAP
ncbi:MAG: glycosyltransferase [Terriglobales bacterium]